jgi:hypothetical protein
MEGSFASPLKPYVSKHQITVASHKGAKLTSGVRKLQEDWAAEDIHRASVLVVFLRAVQAEEPAP